MSYQFDFAKACDEATPAYEFFNSGKNEPSPQFEDNCRMITDQISRSLAVFQTYVKYCTDFTNTVVKINGADERNTERVINAIDAASNKFYGELYAIIGNPDHPQDGGSITHAVQAVVNDAHLVNDTVRPAYNEMRAKCQTYLAALTGFTNEVAGDAATLKANENPECAERAFGPLTKFQEGLIKELSNMEACIGLVFQDDKKVSDTLMKIAKVVGSVVGTAALIVLTNKLARHVNGKINLKDIFH